MKNINICADGGGTSLRLIAFGDDLKLAAQSKSGSVNPNFETNERIGENMAEAVKLLIAELNCGFIINNIYATIVGSSAYFKDILTREISGNLTDNAAFNIISETHSHVLAASLGYTGGIALAGTGSGAIYCTGDRSVHVGGFGIPTGDQGSGAYIGIQGISAAIKYIAGWGEPTMLADKLYEYFNIDGPHLITSRLYKENNNQRSLYAGFARQVAQCERAGDKAAGEIIYSAGRDMGLQMISAIKKAEAENIILTGEPVIIYASGGVWKGTLYMLESMAGVIRGTYPDAVCKNGLFDPVMAGMIKFIFDKNGTITNNQLEHLKKEFKDYLVRINI